MMSNPTVFLVDDDQSVREAVKWLIESADLCVETYESAIEFLQAFDPTRPGCLVLDVRMPGMNGLELQAKLQTEKCGLPVIVITGHGDVPMCIRAFEGGAFAFLEKPINQLQLLDYIQRAIHKDQENRDAPVSDPDVLNRLNRLTSREHQIMEMLVSGKSMKQISSELGISIPTCSKHRSRVLEKMQVDNDVELVRLLLAAQPPVA